MKKPLLILDIDETLIFASKSKLKRAEDCKVFDYYVYERPNLETFLEQLGLNYKLAIWSSASDDYVDEVVNQTILNKYQFEFIWGRSKATYRRNYENDEQRIYSNDSLHYHYVKSLKKVKKLGFKIERILIVDDSPHKSMLNYGNAIYPKAYEGELEDDELLKLIKYLEVIRCEPNFRTIEKRSWRAKYDQKE